MASTPKYKIIIAEDHPVVVQGIRAFLSDDDKFEVLGTATNERDLYDLIDSFDPNILITEVKLPRTNIYRMIRKVQLIAPNLHIIIFSNFTLANLVQNLMEAGVSAYLSKMVSLAEIKDTIIKVYDREKFISASVFETDMSGNNEFNINNHFDRDAKANMDLTQREMEIILFLSRGMTNQDIADRLFISKYTVETHRKNLMKKLNLKTSAQLIYFAMQNGLLEY